MGAPDDKTDFDMYSAFKTSVFSGGINAVDTAINYRYQKSERSIGKAIWTLIQKYGYFWEEFIVCTKGGYVPEDADEGYPGWILLQDLIEKSNGQFKAEDVIAKELGSIHPYFLED